MNSLFKRLNKNATRILPCIVLFMLCFSCKKKDRLSSSTFNFTISPPASTVAKTGSITLTAHGNSASGPVSVSPTWQVSNDTLGSLNTTIGTSVVFQPAALGDVTVIATFDGVQATSHLAIVTYVTPTATTTNPFNIYTDLGIPTGSTLFDNTAIGSLAEISTGYTPEGVNYQRLTNTDDLDNWGISLPAAQDLSAAAGSLKFALRLSRAVASSPTEDISIEITSNGAGVKSFTLASQLNGYARTNVDNWQEISIPISSFGGVNSAQVTVPFALVINTLTSPLTIDIDAIRWEN